MRRSHCRITRRPTSWHPLLRTAAPTLPTRTIIYLGMDVHKDSITIAVLPADAKVPTRLEKLPNDLA